MTLASHLEPIPIPYGRLRLEGDRVLTYEEKPALPVQICSGAYVLGAAALDAVAPDERLDAPDLVRRLLGAGHIVAAFEHQAPWIDVNDPATVERATELVGETPAFERLHRPDVEVVGAIIRGPQGVLLERRPDDAACYAGQWDTPGGKLEAGETPAEAMRRELREELGDAPWEPASLGEFDDLDPTSGRWFRHHVFVAKVPVGHAPEPREGQTLRWGEHGPVASPARRALAWAETGRQQRFFDARTTARAEVEALDALRGLHRSTGDAETLQVRTDAAVPPFPLKVQVQTYTRCNAACTMCPYPAITGEPGYAHQRMDEGLYRDLLSQLAGRGVQRFSPFLMNEPLLDKRLPDWLALAREALPTTTLGLFTNGAALTPELARRLADAGTDELCVSVHGFESTTYQGVMAGLSFDRVFANLRAVTELHRCGALGRMHLQIVTGDVPDVRESLALAPDGIADYVVLKGFSNERAVSEVVAGLDSSAGAAARSVVPRPLCQRPFVKLYITADGTCVLCNCDWRRRVELGRLGEASVEDIWRGARYRAVRERHLRDRFPADHICSRCDYPWAVDEA